MYRTRQSLPSPKNSLKEKKQPVDIFPRIDISPIQTARIGDHFWISNLDTDRMRKSQSWYQVTRQTLLEVNI
ncbi:hypothetical protein LSH36_381g01002 [Paralvinella palmiformis]|uniref:Uncharacterized protein n=1 Tax=Paralvinella palmiformis TaxID=53620 RepID=A0AAD9JDM9_9ANNE|nr:hypothetical protein LSH36_381g01002 [Paralvinella palmiformis]